MKRVQDAGGFISFKRVCGKLATSRSFGDFNFKVSFMCYKITSDRGLVILSLSNLSKKEMGKIWLL